MSERNNDANQPVNDPTAQQTLEALYDSVAQELRSINTSFQGAGAAPARSYGGYHQAAAVLATFEIGKIKSATSPADETIEELLADSVLIYAEQASVSERQVTSPKGEDTKESLLAALGAKSPRWTLLPDIRRRVIDQMQTRAAFLHALDANPERRSDAMQRMLDGYLRQQAPGLASQTAEELACTAQVVEWFAGKLDNLPDQKAIAQQLDAKRLRQPFEKLVGQHFSGREEQLKQLREYVGVLAPKDLLGQLKRGAEKFLNLRQKPPLMIYGPGGVGKSTLVAKFILEHVTVGATQKFPYAYLDFDRPGLLAEEPATLLVEAVRQLGIQYPDVQEHSERVRRDWQEELALVARQAQSLGSDVTNLGSIRLSKQQRTTFLRDFEALLGAMGLSDEPFLLVLDTFEEVQYRSHQYIRHLWEALDELQSIVPRLRTVFSGRALLADFKTQGVPLNDLDAAAAKGFLTASKIEPESLIDTIVKRVGGNPLSLRLAVQIFHNEHNKSEDFFNNLKKGRIQSALYNRVLKHIHDENVMNLAHPGLILRRITPGLILKVLAEPCGVEVKDLDEATKLFNKLSEEITLVAPGGATKDEPLALRHMPEVRRGMIQLLRDDDDQKARIVTIQNNAITYYESSDDPVARAEEIYHRLAVRQDHEVIAARWLDEVKPNLFNAIEELEPVEQAFLAARLEVDVDDSVLAQANPPDWETLVGRRASNFLKLGQPEMALEVLGRRLHRLPGSQLFILEAQAYEQQKKLTEASAVVAQGLRSQPASSSVTFGLRMLDGRLSLQSGKHTEALLALNAARQLALEMKDDIRLLEVTLELLRPSLSSQVGTALTADLKNELQEVVRKLTDAQLAGHLGLLRNAVDKIGSEDEALLTRTIRLVGFESANQTQLRSLARAVAEWDLLVSSSANSDPGLLARKARIPSQSEIFDRWKVFMQTAPPTQVKDAVLLLLEDYPMPPNVRPVLLDIFRLPLPELSSETTKPVETVLASGSSRVSTISTTPITLDLTGDEKQSLTFALMSSFTRDSLAQMLWFRMDLNLDSISLTDSFDSTVEYLVRYAERRGLLVQLITAARESNPGNVYLANFARKFGLAPDSDIDESVESAIYPSASLSPDQWRVTLGEVSGRVCRVEVGNGEGALHATGFLVGPSVLVTSYQALDAVFNGDVPPQDVALRFDFRIHSGTTVNPGTVYRLQRENWLVTSSPPSASPSMTASNGSLNFALVRLEGVPGREPIGGERAEPGAPPRGWISVDPAKALLKSVPDRVLILHYPPGESLKLVLSSSGQIGINEQGTCIFYQVGADAVATGAPCFNSRWELVGLHGGTLPSSAKESYGVTAAAVVKDLQNSGFDLFGTRDKFETTVLRGGRVFLNRQFLRNALREMVQPDGNTGILVVNGPHGSGKTYTREYILDVTYSTPNHRVIYVNLDDRDFGPMELTQTIAAQIGSDIGKVPMWEHAQGRRWIHRLCNYLTAGMSRNTSIKWWLIFDGFSNPLQDETHELIRELALRTAVNDLRIVLLNYTFALPQEVNTRAIREDIKPIERADIESFLLHQLQQQEQAIPAERIKSIVDHVIAATGDASATEMYPTANRLRLLNRAISNVMPRDYS